MTSQFAQKRSSYGTTDKRWLRDGAPRARTHGVTIRGTAFAEGTYPGRLVKSGTYIGKYVGGGNDKLAGPYDNAATDGRETAVGILLNDIVVADGVEYLVAVVNSTTVDRRYLPSNSGRDAAAEVDLPAITHIN